jgi:hypothetical protein
MFLTVAGVICVPVGIVMAQDRHQDLKDMGTTFLIAGGVGLAVGLPIWLLSRTTVDVKSSSGTSLRANGFVF